MHSDPAAGGAEQLLCQMGWLRGLARGLVRDADLAEDLAQEAALAALERPNPGHRGWLAGVLRRRALERERGEARRLRRERRVARGENATSASELVEEVATQRAVVDAVLRLEEPYREAVLLRFYEDLPPRRIAQRTRVPVNTVKSRLQRALGKLRADLDARNGGDRDAWLLALLPLARGPFSVTGTLGGGATVGTKIKIAAASVVLAAGVAVAFTQLRPNSALPSSAETQAALPPATVDRSLPEAAERIEQQMPEASRPAPAVAAAAAPASLVRGRLLDAEGAPLPWVEVGIRAEIAGPADAHTAISDVDGRFELAAPGQLADIVVTAPNYATVLAGRYQPGRSLEVVVVAAPLLSFGGEVVSSGGSSLVGAQVAVHLPEGFRTRFQAVLDASRPAHWNATTDGLGRFSLAEAPRIGGATLNVTHDGFQPWLRPLPAWSDQALHVVLEPTRPEAGRLMGQVVDPAGALVAGAKVSLGQKITSTDELGQFRFDLEGPAQGAHELLAIHRGFLPARMAAPGGPGTGDSGWPSYVLLRLGPAPLAVTGRIVDAQGQPVAGAQVWAKDPTFFGDLGPMTAVVEGVVGGGKTFDELIQLARGAANETEARRIVQNTPNQTWYFARSAADGGFRLEGLLPRDYTLRAMDPRTLLMVDHGPVAPGDGEVVIALPTDTLHPRVAGRVLDRDGQPVPGATIVPQCDSFVLHYPDGGGAMTMHAQTELQTTDAQGRFAFADFPGSSVYFRVQGDEIMPEEFSRGARGIAEAWTGSLEEIEIVVSRRVHFQVELANPAEADRFAMARADGELLIISEFSAEARSERREFRLVDGKSSVLAVPDTASTLILYSGATEVRRVPVRLRAGELNALRF